MFKFVLLGLVIGINGAYLANRGKKDFRKKLLEQFESFRSASARTAFAKAISANRAKWIRSVSLVRKPFNKQINLAIETSALLVALASLINSLVNFDRVFKTAAQGDFILVFLSVIIAYIPSEWLITGIIEKDMHIVLGEIEVAVEHEKLDTYITEAEKVWK